MGFRLDQGVSGRRHSMTEFLGSISTSFFAFGFRLVLCLASASFYVLRPAFGFSLVLRLAGSHLAFDFGLLLQLTSVSFCV